jgi:hypothetical protein
VVSVAAAVVLALSAASSTDVVALARASLDASESRSVATVVAEV